MSYCRWGADSDVYVYATAYPDRDNHGRTRYVLICCGCKLLDGDTAAERRSEAAMISHLEQHRAAGHKVPAYAIERLLKEMEQG